MTERVAFANFPAECFPIKIEAYKPTGEVVWRMTIEGPQVLYVPPLARIYRCQVGVRAKFANGIESEVE